MICGQFHSGSGLGDQLFRYITVRTLAEEKGYEWVMATPQHFKGAGFMKISYGTTTLLGPSVKDFTSPRSYWNEKDVRDPYGNDIRSYDPEINFVEDYTIIDGSFEDSKYWGHNLENINKWLAVEPLDVPNDVCIIGFRGGEYATQPDLFLPTSYYEQAVIQMHKINPKMRFEVHTDDPQIAELMLTPIFGTNPDKITYVENKAISHSKHSNMGFNWRSARYAKYAIIPNSAFFILPRLLSHDQGPPGYCVTIAPRGWSRRNLAKGNQAGHFLWARPACYYKQFTYI